MAPKDTGRLASTTKPKRQRASEPRPSFASCNPPGVHVLEMAHKRSRCARTSASESATLRCSPCPNFGALNAPHTKTWTSWKRRLHHYPSKIVDGQEGDVEVRRVHGRRVAYLATTKCAPTCVSCSILVQLYMYRYDCTTIDSSFNILISLERYTLEFLKCLSLWDLY